MSNITINLFCLAILCIPLFIAMIIDLKEDIKRDYKYYKHMKEELEEDTNKK